MAANADSKKRKSSGASTMGGKSSMPCFRNAIEGNPDCAQRADEPVCLGLKKSLENSLKKSDCIRRSGSECVEWGHNEKTQSEWVSIASFHLSEFGLCVKNKYGNENSNGLREALLDPSFLAFIEQQEDGSGDYLLDRQEILMRTLRGERFSQILNTSPLQKKLGNSTFHRLVDAADTPAPLKKEELAKVEDTLIPERNSFRKPKSPFSISNEMHAAATQNNSDIFNRNSQTINNSIETENYIREIAQSAQGKSKQKLRQKNSYSLGLDLNIFDRISIAYGRKEKEMQGMERYLLEYPVPPVKDMREALNRGGGL